MRRAWLVLALAVSLGQRLWAQPQGLYPADVAQRWLPLSEVMVRLKDPLGIEAATPVSVLRPRPVPFQGLGIAPQKAAPSRPKTWSLPPFSNLGPPGSESAPQLQAPVFTGLSHDSQAASPALRPRPGKRRQLARFQDYQLPEPLSRICYASGAGLCQLSLYGGSTSFAAEQAYQALYATLDQHEVLEGFGQEAVWGRYQEQLDKPKEFKERRFDSIPVQGQARPDLIDPGLNQARQAPAFKEISSRPYQKGHLDLSRLPSVRQEMTSRAPRNYWVLLAYLPDKAVTLELLLDRRLGDLPELIELATEVRSRIRKGS